MTSDVANLTATCEELLPHVKAGVNILLEGDYLHNKKPEDALFGHVCGRASRVLGYLLTNRGFDVKKVETYQLGPDYACADHKFLIVNLPQETIVDPSYQQFINLFHLDRAHIPQEEILVVPYEQLDSKIDQFVNCET
jgi:hypothetical protein